MSLDHLHEPHQRTSPRREVVPPVPVRPTAARLQRVFGNQFLQRALSPRRVVQRMPTFTRWSIDREVTLQDQTEEEVIAAVREYLEFVADHQDYKATTAKSWQLAGSLGDSLSGLWEMAYHEKVVLSDLLKALDTFATEVNKLAGVVDALEKTPPVEEKKEKQPVEEKKETEKTRPHGQPQARPQKTSNKVENLREQNAKAQEEVRKQLTKHFNTSWVHVSKGEVRGGESKSGEIKGGTPVGYHWKGLGGRSVLVAVGSKYGQDTTFGTYKQYVVARNEESDYLAKPDAVNAKESSFWPDNWTEEDIRDVCVSLTSYKTNFTHEVTLHMTSNGKACKGMRVRLNPDSFFPDM